MVNINATLWYWQNIFLPELFDNAFFWLEIEDTISYAICSVVCNSVLPQWNSIQQFFCYGFYIFVVAWLYIKNNNQICTLWK